MPGSEISVNTTSPNLNTVQAHLGGHKTGSLQQECAAGKKTKSQWNSNRKGSTLANSTKLNEYYVKLCVNIQCCHKHTVIVPFHSCPAETVLFYTLQCENLS